MYFWGYMHTENRFHPAIFDHKFKQFGAECHLLKMATFLSGEMSTRFTGRRRMGRERYQC